MSNHALDDVAKVMINGESISIRRKIRTQRQAGFEMNRYAFPRHEFATQPVIFEARTSARLRIEAALNKA